MKNQHRFFPGVLAFAAIMLAAGQARADAREEGPIEIEQCQTIDQPGSYRLVNNLTFSVTGVPGTCLDITVDFVTIDLGGFTISGPGSQSGNLSTGISAQAGAVVRNGSISGFVIGVSLGDGSIAEGLRVVGGGGPLTDVGIRATGIVRSNTVVDIIGIPGRGSGISATGIVSGNYVNGTRVAGIGVGQGSTVIGNTALGSIEVGGIVVDCPSNVTNNTAVNNHVSNLVLNGEGCNNTNNVAP